VKRGAEWGERRNVGGGECAGGEQWVRGGDSAGVRVGRRGGGRGEEWGGARGGWGGGGVDEWEDEIGGKRRAREGVRSGWGRERRRGKGGCEGDREGMVGDRVTGGGGGGEKGE